MSPTNNQPKIRLGLSYAFLNKSVLPGYNEDWAKGYSFKPSEVTVSDLIDHILAGKAWTPGYFRGNTRRKNTWKFSQLIALDYDKGLSVAQAREISFVRQYAILAHATPSSEEGAFRTRIVFILSEPVERLEAWESLAEAIISFIGVKADRASRVVTQPYYGSTNRVEEPYVNPDAILPIEVAGALTFDQATEDYLRAITPPVKYQPIATDSSFAARRVGKAWAKATQRLIAAVPGERNTVLYRSACWLSKLAAGGWPITYTEIEVQLGQLAREKGLGETEISDTLKSAKRNGENDPIPLRISEKQFARAQRRERQKKTDGAALPVSSSAPLDPIKVNVPYLSTDTFQEAFKTVSTIAVISDVATRKTAVAIELAGYETGRVMCVSHREKLTRGMVNTARRKGVIFGNYKEMCLAEWGRVSRLAICINSVVTMSKTSGLPELDFLIIDEFSQLLEHVFGDNETWKRHTDDQILAGECLEFIIRKAKRVLVMDAHLDQVGLDYLKSLRPDIRVVVNTFHPERGPLFRHENQESITSTGIRLIKENAGPVAFAFASKDAAKIFTKELNRQFGKENILLVTADNGGGKRQQRFLENPNEEVGKHRAIAYSPIIGTGYDITAPVRAVILIGAPHLTAYDHRQMAGRFRDTQELHVYLPEPITQLEIDPEVIYQERLENSEQTMWRLNKQGLAVPNVPERVKTHLYWHSRVMARRNFSINHQVNHFLSLCEGYKIEDADDDPDFILQGRLDGTREVEERELRENVLTVLPIDYETYQSLHAEGMVSETDEAGFLRWKIERAGRRKIDPHLRDELETHEKRAALRAFCDLLDDISALKLHDAEQVNEDVPAHKRDHRFRRSRTAIPFVNLLLDNDGRPPKSTKSELTGLLEPLIATWGGELRLLYGYRPNRQKNPISVLNRILKAVGLKLESEQQTVNGKRVRLYGLNEDHFDGWVDLASTRLEELKKERVADSLKLPAKSI